jgi:hypothetical protein
VENVEQGEPIGFNVIFEARHDLFGPVFSFHVLTEHEVTVFGFNRTLELRGDEADVVRAGQRVRLSGTIENRLVPGRYHVRAIISRNRSHGDLALHLLRLLDFMVYGTRRAAGSVTVDVNVDARLEGGQ